MVRKLDELGRIVVPADFRKENGWKQGDHIEITEYQDEIILKKPNNKTCNNCGIRCKETDNYCSNCGTYIK